jgi:hypothetical protein
VATATIVVLASLGSLFGVKSVAADSSVLNAGQSLSMGQTITSTNGAEQLVLQPSDGNLVLYYVGSGDGAHGSVGHLCV